MSKNDLDRKYDQELVLRFFSFKNWRDNYKHEIGDFLTDYMEAVSDPGAEVSFDFAEERKIFEKTFEVLCKAQGQAVFSGYNRTGGFMGRFLSLHYEAFALGIQNILERLDPLDEAEMEKLSQKLDVIKKDPKFIAMTTGGGKNYKKDLDQRIAFVQAGLE